mmetsp:Transcript_2302/g.9193  ORF Transcript_2302/g.9193 Transcript_2302/m.9193 type:complete len:229 (-) Transcript_2302:91-777(-)
MATPTRASRLVVALLRVAARTEVVVGACTALEARPLEVARAAAVAEAGELAPAHDVLEGARDATLAVGVRVLDAHLLHAEGLEQQAEVLAPHRARPAQLLLPQSVCSCAQALHTRGQGTSHPRLRGGLVLFSRRDHHDAPARHARLHQCPHVELAAACDGLPRGKLAVPRARCALNVRAVVLVASASPGVGVRAHDLARAPPGTSLPLATHERQKLRHAGGARQDGVA